MSSAASAPAAGFDVFLCHAGEDKASVVPLYLALRHLHLRVFFDRGELSPTGLFGADLLAALTSTRIGVLWLTRSFYSAPWCLFESSLLMLQSKGVLDGHDTAAVVAALTDASKQQRANMGFDDAPLTQWLSARPRALAIGSCALYPVFVHKDAKPVDLPAANTRFRLTSQFYSALSDPSGAPSRGDLNQSDLLQRVISDVYRAARSDELAPTQSHLATLVAESQRLAARLNVSAGVSALDEAVDALRVWAVQPPLQQAAPQQAAAASQAAGRPELDLDGDETVLFQATSDRAVEAHRDFTHANPHVKSKGTNFTLFKG